MSWGVGHVMHGVGIIIIRRDGRGRGGDDDDDDKSKNKKGTAATATSPLVEPAWLTAPS